MTVLNKVTTGCKKIDNVLGGGIPAGSIALLYGEAETGKTTLAMQCAVNCTRKGYKTIFLDCDGTFSAKRLSQIASEDFKKIAPLIILMKPSNFTEQTSAIDGLADYITKSCGLVVIDTITSLYRVETSEKPEKTFKLNRELNRQMASLAQIAKTQRIPLIITSQVRSVVNETYVHVEPVATRVLKFWADIIVAMKPTGNPQVIKAVLEKNQKKEQPLTCYLRISERGIYDLKAT